MVQSRKLPRHYLCSCPPSDSIRQTRFSKVTSPVVVLHVLIQNFRIQPQPLSVLIAATSLSSSDIIQYYSITCRRLSQLCNCVHFLNHVAAVVQSTIFHLLKGNTLRCDRLLIGHGAAVRTVRYPPCLCGPSPACLTQCAIFS